MRILPPAPRPGSLRYERDRAVFRATRRAQTAARWTLAIADADSGVAATMRDFSCALGLDLTPARAPRLAGLLAKVRVDGGLATFRGKWRIGRRRPFEIDSGQICAVRTITLDTSPDYPSGHATWGWAAATILAELAPDRATPLLTRGRAYGESRVVCGVHNLSAVEAGRTYGAALVAAEHGVAAFRSDLEAARAEISALRRQSSAGDAQSEACRAEAEVLAAPAFAD